MAVWVGFADLAIGEFPHADAIRVEDIFLTVGKLNRLDA